MKFPIGGGGHGARMTQQDASEMMEEYKIEGIKVSDFFFFFFFFFFFC